MSIVLGILAGGCALFLLFLKGGSPAQILDGVSLLFVGCGTLGALLVICPFSSLARTISVIFGALRPVGREQELVEKTVELSKAARQGGIFALEGVEDGIRDNFLKKGISLILESADPATVRSILERESLLFYEKEKAAAELVDRLAAFCMGIGMVGTLADIAIMLARCRVGENLGPQISHALLPGVYGAAISYLLLYPFAARIKTCSDKKKERRGLAIEGVMAVQAGEPPTVVRERLEIYAAGEKRC